MVIDNGFAGRGKCKAVERELIAIVGVDLETTRTATRRRVLDILGLGLNGHITARDRVSDAVGIDGDRSRRAVIDNRYRMVPDCIGRYFNLTCCTGSLLSSFVFIRGIFHLGVARHHRDGEGQ